MQGDNNDNCKVINGEHNTQRTQDKAQINHEPQVAKVHKLHKGGAKILSSGKVVGNPGNWNVVRDRRGKINVAPPLATVVENKYDVLDRAVNIMVDSNTTKTNIIQNNGTINTGDPSEDVGVGRKKMSTKEWITKAFGEFLQGDHQLSSSSIIRDSLEVSQDDNTQRNKGRSNDDKDVEEKLQNIDNGEKRLDKDKAVVATVSTKSDKCSDQEKNLEQHEEDEQGMHNLVAIGATDQKVNSPKKHGELSTTNEEQNNHMDNVKISRDTIDTSYNSPETHGKDHNNTEQLVDAKSKRVNNACQCSNNSSISTSKKIHESERENNMAIVIVPAALQSDDCQVVRVPTESPNTTLHNILIHKWVDAEPEDLAEIKWVDCTTVSESNIEQIYIDADLSPMVMKAVKSAKNDKKQGDGESAQPLRVQPRRQVISQYSKYK
ncbi:hypothetical protein KY284_020638 [Solanum tuberosum]|nr:hypothetical protein KY284_020638 [Solanum tuberosum]